VLKKEFINPHPMGFTNTVTYGAQGVTTIIVSGQVGYADEHIGKTFEEQAEMAHQNLVDELAAAGATRDSQDILATGQNQQRRVNQPHRAWPCRR